MRIEVLGFNFRNSFHPKRENACGTLRVLKGHPFPTT